MNGSPLSRDTTSRAQRMQIELWRRMTPLSKLEAVSVLTRSVLQLSLTGIRQRFPTATDSECRIRLARLTLGPELAERVYPGSAKLSGL